MSALRYVPLLPLLLVLGGGAIVTAVVFAMTARRSTSKRAMVVTARLLLGAALVGVLVLTLAGGPGSGVNLVPGAGIARQLDNVNRGLGLMNVAGNVVMFVPIGALLVLGLGKGPLQAAMSGAALSSILEGMQLLLGRSADIDDVLLNTLGAALGAVLAVAVMRRVGDDPAPS